MKVASNLTHLDSRRPHLLDKSVERGGVRGAVYERQAMHGQDLVGTSRRKDSNALIHT